MGEIGVKVQPALISLVRTELRTSKKLRAQMHTSLNRSNCNIVAKAMIFLGAKQTITLVFVTLSTFTRG